jgi:3-phenylpropionate/trans-cinnamate dioxygenase alpha subunit
MTSNWKFAADNFSPDGYHFNITHISALKVGLGGRSTDALRQQPPSFTVHTPFGHGTSLATENRPPRLPELTSYLEGVWSQREQQMGELRAKKVWTNTGTIFPNFSFQVTDANHTIRIWHPRGPDKVEAWSWCIVDKEAPPEIKDIYRVWNLRGQSGPGGMLEQDDGENWNMCTESSFGRVARRYDFNYQLRLGQERFDEELPGTFVEGPGEANQRNIYGFWADLMAGKSWSELARK